MRVVLLALGSRGDTEPCVALGARLRARGHDVAVVAPPRYAHTVTDAGLEHRPLSVDPAEVMASERGQALLASGPFGFVRGLRTVAAPLAERVLHDAALAASDADVVVAPPVGGLGRHLGERYGVPHVLLHFQPSEPTRAFANPLLGPRELGPRLNRASYAVVEAGSATVLRPFVNRARRRVLGLPALRRGTVHLDRRDRVPVLCPVSPVLVPRPADWPGHVHLTGSWPTPGRLPLPPATLAFLAAGPAPVFVGFGSMVPPDPGALAAVVTAALRRAGRRAVVQGLPVTAAAGLHVVDDVDHAALFARVSAVVHHGGAGTTAAGARAGVPAVVCPFFGDQPWWAGRLVALGVAPAPLPAGRLDVESLVAALRRVHDDSAMRRRAARLGCELAAEDGTGAAAEVVEQVGRRAARRGLRRVTSALAEPAPAVTPAVPSAVEPAVEPAVPSAVEPAVEPAVAPE